MEYKDLLDILIEQNLSLTCMESLTGGLFASTFTSIPNASKVFHGGAVTYTDSIKESFGVSKKTIESFGAISKECAKEMAIQASLFFNSDIAVSFTGNAGPSESEGKPVGLVYIGIKFKDKVSVFELHLEGTRNQIRKQCVDFAFSTLIDDFVQKSS
jgi:PncC family amidohydrolase